MNIFLFILNSLGNMNNNHIEGKTTNKIMEMKSLIEGNQSSKNKTKVVLVFSEVSQLESLMKDMNEYEMTINPNKVEDEDKIKRKKEVSKAINKELIKLVNKDLDKKLKVDEKKQLPPRQETDFHDTTVNNKFEKELENIPLGYKVLCILFNNLKLLEDSQKLKDVEITDILITNENTDVYNKLRFSEKDNKFVDSTGYFIGSRINTSKIEEVAKIYKTGLFHLNNLTKEKEERNNLGMRTLFKYIATLKKTSLMKLIKEDCEMNIVDKVIFYNNYDKNLEDTLNVCVCKEDLCKNCSGPFKINRGDLK